MTALWIPLLPFAVFFACLLFSAMRRPRLCPDCNALLPALQSPFTRTRRQWIEGGLLCRDCGCEADLAGRKIAAAAPPQRRSIAISIGVLMLTIVPAILLLATLFQR